MSVRAALTNGDALALATPKQRSFMKNDTVPYHERKEMSSVPRPGEHVLVQAHRAQHRDDAACDAGSSGVCARWNSPIERSGRTAPDDRVVCLVAIRHNGGRLGHADVGISDSDDGGLRSPGAEQRLDIGLVARQHSILALHEERDVGVDELVGSVLSEKFSNPLGAHVVQGGYICASQDSGKVGLSASVAPDLCDRSGAGEHRGPSCCKTRSMAPKARSRLSTATEAPTSRTALTLLLAGGRYRAQRPRRRVLYR